MLVSCLSCGPVRLPESRRKTGDGDFFAALGSDQISSDLGMSLVAACKDELNPRRHFKCYFGWRSHEMVAWDF